MTGQSPPPISRTGSVSKPIPETSFYYKESSLSEGSGSYHPGERKEMRFTNVKTLRSKFLIDTFPIKNHACRA